MSADEDTFILYDLRVEVVATDRPMVCNHQAGDSFELSGENLSCPDPNCGALFRITRTGTTTFRHSDVTVVPMGED